MTPQDWKEILPFVTAFAEGKTVEFRRKNTTPSCYWVQVDRLFDNPPNEWLKYEFRIKPTPKFRAWKPEEVPVGAVMRTSVGDYIIMGRGTRGFGNGYVEISEVNKVMGGWQVFQSLGCTYSTDHGKTWLPCGVEESV